MKRVIVGGSEGDIIYENKSWSSKAYSKYENPQFRKREEEEKKTKQKSYTYHVPYIIFNLDFQNILDF